ncbi:MAG: hypothetical protein K2L70_03005 [Clostridia bacterium]|nr:hypothetical protein [Clostridia bacterium]
MCIFKKKNVADKVKDDRELISLNAKSIDSLIVLAKDNRDMTSQLKELREKIAYLIPSDNSKVVDYDKSIKNKIGDLRIALTKSNGETSKKTDETICDIQLTIADRNARL